MVTKRQPDDTKLLVLPGRLVDRLKEVSAKRGTSLSGFAAEVLEVALRAEELGAPLNDAVDAYRMVEFQRGAGAMMVQRSSLSRIVDGLGAGRAEELGALWEEAGHWYGRYVASKLGGGEVFPFLAKELAASWNLDEVEIRGGEDAFFRFTCFVMTESFTGLLLSYVSGLMGALGFREVERDHLRGMATVRYARAPGG